MKPRRKSPLRRQLEQQQQTGVTAGVAIGAAVLGAGTAIYATNKQTDASQAANTQNAQNVSQANDQSWTNYLLSRGISTGSVVPAGTLPSGGSAVNTKLPLWATVNVPQSMAGPGGSSALGGAISGTGYSPIPRGVSPGGASPVGANPGSAPGATAQSRQITGPQGPYQYSTIGGYTPPNTPAINL